jgi:hypothetical protein
MTNQQPITPPPELVEEWASMLEYHPDEKVFGEVAQWGADQELEACCSEVAWLESTSMAKKIRAARRPKPLTLKEQALRAADLLFDHAEIGECALAQATIRRALEALPND